MNNPSSRQHRPLAGILFCTFSLLGFAIQDSIVKNLTSRYALLEILTLRSIIAFVLLLIIGLALHGGGILRANNPTPLMLRGLLAFCAFTTYYLALSQIPLADAASVYMTAPLFVTLLSAVLLKEKVGIHRWGAVLLGLTAVLIMLSPGSSVFRIAGAIPLFSALCYAMIPILNRRVGMSEHAMTMGIYTTVTYLFLILTASALVHVFPLELDSQSVIANFYTSWSKIATNDLVVAMAAGCLFTLSLLGITQAYRIAIVSTVAPFEYSYLVWATAIGFLIFSHVPNLRTILGGITVVICGCYIVYRENKVKLQH